MKFALSALTGFIGMLSLVIGTGCTGPVGEDATVHTSSVIAPSSKVRGQLISLFDEALPTSAVESDSLLGLLYSNMLLDHSTKVVEEYYERKITWEKRYGNPDGVLREQTNAFEELKKVGAWDKVLPLSRELSRATFLREDYAESFRFANEGLKVARQVGDSVMMGWSLTGMANPLRYAGMEELAKEYTWEAIDIARSRCNTALEARALINLGIMYTSEGKLDTAELYQVKGYLLALEHNHERYIEIGLLNLAGLRGMQGRYDEALTLLNEGLERAQGVVKPETVVMNTYKIMVYLSRGEYEKSKECLEQSLIQADTIGFTLGYTHALGAASLYYEALGEYEQAMAYNVRFTQAKTKSQGSLTGIKLQTMLSENELAGKNAEIIQLRKQEQEQRLRTQRTRQLLIGSALLIIVATIAAFLLFRFNVLRKHAEQRQTIAEARLEALQSRMNPHFIFNTINSIQNFILKSDKYEAYSYLGKFAGLLRTVNQTSGKMHTTLDNEVELLRNYLELESIRFRKRLTFEVRVEEELLEIGPLIPGMMIQPVVENAIVHGISGLSYIGHISVIFRSHKEGLVCSVTDNGRGRTAAAALAAEVPEEHLSMATANGLERVAVLNRIGYTNADIVIEDLMVGTRPSGTTVKIYLPFLTDDKIISIHA